MTTTPSPETWRRVIRQANQGDPRHLLELLLRPTQTDGRGAPLPGCFVDLPDDGELRLAIVRVLMLGPWKAASSVGELMTKSGWGKTRPRLSSIEADFAAVFEALGGSLEGAAEAYGIEPETLQGHIKKARKR